MVAEWHTEYKIRHTKGATTSVADTYENDPYKDHPEDDPRRQGKMHYHEYEVRPIEVARIVHQNPVGDLFELKERHHKGADVQLPLRTIQLHVSQLLAGEMTRMHKHHNEAAIYVIEGKGYSLVQGVRYDWQQGDFLYMPSMTWHQHFNEGPERAVYLGITNKRMLDWLGLDRRVEAGINMTDEQVQKEIETVQPSPYSWYSITPEGGVRFGPPGFIKHEGD